MLVKPLTFLMALLAAPSAFAAADLATSVTVAPSSALVYSTARYTVRVANIGNKNASNCSVQIALPATHTSPQVYVLGNLGATSAGCSQSGTTLTCALGTINKFKNKSVFFDIALPVSSESLDFVATAATTNPENGYANNTAPFSASQTFYASDVATTPTTPVTMVNRHCTGTGLTAWFECTLFPSSISAHDAVFHDDGSITIPDYGDVTGGWVVTPGASGNALYFYYEEAGGVIAEFDGWGVDGDCFEGLTTFPGGGPYVAPYEVCPL